MIPKWREPDVDAQQLVLVSVDGESPDSDAGHGGALSLTTGALSYRAPRPRHQLRIAVAALLAFLAVAHPPPAGAAAGVAQLRREIESLREENREMDRLVSEVSQAKAAFTTHVKESPAPPRRPHRRVARTEPVVRDHRGQPRIPRLGRQ